MRSAKIALKLVFRTPRYFLIALGVAALFMLLVTTVVYSSAVIFTLRYSKLIAVPGNLSQIIWLNNSAGSLAVLFSTAVTVGVNAALIVFLIKRRMAPFPAELTSGVGMFLGLIGVGCASCGSVVLSSVLGIGATTSLLTLLPWQGKELGVVALFISGLSAYLACRNIANPPICAVPKSSH